MKSASTGCALTLVFFTMKITKHRIFEQSSASMTVERRSSALWQCRQQVRRTIFDAAQHRNPSAICVSQPHDEFSVDEDRPRECPACHDGASYPPRCGPLMRSAPSPPSPADASGAWNKPSTGSMACSRHARGYIGSRTTNPTYETVSSGTTGHAEAVQVVYDPRLDYESLLLTFWHNIDPTARDRQFCDFGSQYRSAIFYHDEAQQRLAQQSKTALETKRFDRPLETQIVPAGTFYPAEEYHQITT